jgi:hypothetical protein
MISLTSRRPIQVFLNGVPDPKQKDELLPREEELAKALSLAGGRD